MLYYIIWYYSIYIYYSHSWLLPQNLCCWPATLLAAVQQLCYPEAMWQFWGSRQPSWTRHPATYSSRDSHVNPFQAVVLDLEFKTREGPSFTDWLLGLKSTDPSCSSWRMFVVWWRDIQRLLLKSFSYWLLCNAMRSNGGFSQRTHMEMFLNIEKEFSLLAFYRRRWCVHSCGHSRCLWPMSSITSFSRMSMTGCMTWFAGLSRKLWNEIWQRASKRWSWIGVRTHYNHNLLLTLAVVHLGSLLSWRVFALVWLLLGLAAMVIGWHGKTDSCVLTRSSCWWGWTRLICHQQWFLTAHWDKLQETQWSFLCCPVWFAPCFMPLTYEG